MKKFIAVLFVVSVVIVVLSVVCIKNVEPSGFVSLFETIFE